ncbi:aminotransferase class IV [Flavobacteriaceae bacterium LMO-SS05]
MINLNGNIIETSVNRLSLENRGYKFGDALFETLKVVDNRILFWEDHYFRLMASMRILRMEIPMTFTMEFLEQEILKTIEANNFKGAAFRVRLNIDRGEGGKYHPKTPSINYNIIAEQIDNDLYILSKDANCTVDLFKDYFVAPGLLSTLKSNNKIINVLGSIYAKENSLDNCLLLNTNKNVVEALNGNLFLVNGTTIKTPPVLDGCLKGIMRKQIMGLVKHDETYNLLEESISPFELQKADELFVTNVIQGIQPISIYRKKTYGNKVSNELRERLNAKLKLL